MKYCAFVKDEELEHSAKSNKRIIGNTPYDKFHDRQKNKHETVINTSNPRGASNMNQMLRNSRDKNSDGAKAAQWIAQNVPKGLDGSDTMGVIAYFTRPDVMQKLLTFVYGIQGANEVIRSGKAKSIVTSWVNQQLARR